MPANITDVSTFTAPIVTPTDGDARNAAGVTTAHQGLANRTRHLRDNLFFNGMILGTPPEIHVDTATSSLAVGPIFGVVIGEKTLSQSSATLVSYTGLSVSTWYYLYAYNMSSALAFELSTMAPDGSRVFKTGDSTRRFLCSLRTDASGVPLPFRKIGSRIIFGWDTTTLFTPLSAGTAGTFTDVSLVNHIPAHSYLSYLAIDIGGGDVGATIYLRPNGTARAGQQYFVSTNTSVTTYGEVETFDRIIEYKVTPISAPTVNPFVGIHVAGYSE